MKFWPKFAFLSHPSPGLLEWGESWLWRAHLRAPKGTMPPREKAALEVFKFAVYLAVPISLTVLVAYNRPMLEAVIKNVSSEDACVHQTRDWGRFVRSTLHAGRAGSMPYPCGF